MSLKEIAREAKDAFSSIQALSSEERDEALQLIFDELKTAKNQVLEANTLDMEAAEKLLAEGKMSKSMCKRLDLRVSEKYESMMQGVLDVKNLPDPLGHISYANKIDDGLELYRVSCAVGVLLVIFEARPEVVVNITSLAIKSGNAVILKGGKESTHSFDALSNVIRKALSKSKVPLDAVQLVHSRDEVSQLLQLDEYIDLVIPRGSDTLVKNIKNNTKIPVLGHSKGLCSVYVHEDADLDQAVKLVWDSKTNYPAACNAVETVLINQSVLESHFPAITKKLIDSGVEVRCDDASYAVAAKALPEAVASGKLKHSVVEDYDTEFSDLILCVKVVNSLSEAIQHINLHGSKHTDCIITTNEAAAKRFMTGVDAAGVYWNASTRFADGFRYGFGTEVGISTNKIHARGPMGLEGLTIYKYMLRGHGQIVGDYGVGPGKRSFKHEPLPAKHVSEL
ncbi:gamma-glutamyl phosphate reductase Pro1 [Schizosaccharomyces japonicus yFS275]|uniref:glutamate-5-semialdehyde dehydrogenase n=1 Tax=Schizosaccharomyces japonicus (strain yFS275 / FY16936) TaxID=402676 RepID=B6JW88_SCHJY|nr:gamma-glutamyl phosphate reductase Pro1 [Schizosaccharomyces japonicus yFS275]EEB05639.1 gamma-glutamyl phosphate reductase Pro1 [Schizosaccharomyces japonicus yFS275]